MSVKNKYRSNFCNGPCGLVDIFAYDSKIGCYETHKLNFIDISSFKNQKKIKKNIIVSLEFTIRILPQKETSANAANMLPPF